MIRTSERKKTIHCNLTSMYMAAGSNSRAAFILHAPESCSQIVFHSECRRMRRREGFIADNLFTTRMTDKDAIFGGAEKLEQCLRDVSAAMRPEYMAVAAGCVAGVIGDDMRAACLRAEEETHTPVVLLDGAGFMMDQHMDTPTGVAMSLFEKFIFPEKDRYKREVNSLAVLGVNRLTVRREEEEGLSSFFGEMGFEKTYFPPMGMSLEELREVGRVSAVTAYWNVPDKKEYVLQAAEKFSHIMGVPFFPTPPLDTIERIYAGTMDLSAILGQKTQGKVAAASLRRQYEDVVRECQGVLDGKSFLFGVGMPLRYFDPLSAISLAQDAGMKLTGVILYKELNGKERALHEDYLRKYITAPILEESDVAPEADVRISTLAKPTKLPQFCIAYRRIGIPGIQRFFRGLAETVERGSVISYEKGL